MELDTGFPNTITITGVHLWIGLKLLFAVVLQRWEMNRNPSGWAIHTIARRFLWHALINPELAIVKGLAFIPVFFLTGLKYIDRFLPVRTTIEHFVIEGNGSVARSCEDTRPRCPICGDTGLQPTYDQTLRIPCKCNPSNRKVQ